MTNPKHYRQVVTMSYVIGSITTDAIENMKKEFDENGLVLVAIPFTKDGFLPKFEFMPQGLQ